MAMMQSTATTVATGYGVFTLIRCKQKSASGLCVARVVSTVCHVQCNGDTSNGSDTVHMS